MELKPVYEIDSIPIVQELLHRSAGSAILPLPVFRRDIDRGEFKAALIVAPEIRRDLVIAVAGKRRHSPALEIVKAALKSAAL